MEEHLSTVNIWLGWIPSLRVLLGKSVEVKITHRGPVDKIVAFVGKTEIGSVVA